MKVAKVILLVTLTSLLMSCGNAWVPPNDAACVVLKGPLHDLNASVVASGEQIISIGAGEVITDTRILTVVYDAACPAVDNTKKSP